MLERLLLYQRRTSAKSKFFLMFFVMLYNQRCQKISYFTYESKFFMNPFEFGSLISIFVEIFWKYWTYVMLHNLY